MEIEPWPVQNKWENKQQVRTGRVGHCADLIYWRSTLENSLVNKLNCEKRKFRLFLHSFFSLRLVPGLRSASQLGADSECRVPAYTQPTVSRLHFPLKVCAGMSFTIWSHSQGRHTAGRRLTSIPATFWCRLSISASQAELPLRTAREPKSRLLTRQSLQKLSGQLARSTAEQIDSHCKIRTKDTFKLINKHLPSGRRSRRALPRTDYFHFLRGRCSR